MGTDYGYVHHSEWLKLYNIPYYLFFLTLTVHTFFGITVIQMVVLGKIIFLYLIGFMYTILFLQSSDYGHHKKAVCSFVIVWIKRLLSLQLAVLALTEIGPIKESIIQYATLNKVLYVLGFVLD